MTKSLTGRISEEDFRYQSDVYDFPTGWSHLGVLMPQIDTLEGTRYEEQDRDLPLFAVNNMVGESRLLQSGLHLSCWMMRRLLYLLLNWTMKCG